MYELERIRVRQIIHSSSGHHFGNVEFSSIQEPYCNYKHKSFSNVNSCFVRYMKRYVLNTHCTCVHIQNGCKKIMFSSSTGNYYRDQMPTYLKKRQNNTLNKKCVSCYQSLMGCRICERTNKAVEATRLSQKNIIPHIRDFSLYPLQQIQSSKCINGPGIGKGCILRTDSNKL